MSLNWSEQVVLITGASSGIGRAVAIELAKRGVSLGLLARRADMLDELASEVEKAGGRATVLAADVTDAAAVQFASNRLREQYGRIDIMLANAGIAQSTDVKDLRADEVASLININVLGAVNAVTAVLPQMIERKSGHLAVISSLAGYRGLPKSAAYCASKAAVSAFFESLRIDLKDAGVAVTIIHPGFIKTELTAGRQAKMPYLMEVEDAAVKIVEAVEARKKSVAFPWQLASLVRAGMVFPIALYDRIAARNSFRE